MCWNGFMWKYLVYYSLMQKLHTNIEVMEKVTLSQCKGSEWMLEHLNWESPTHGGVALWGPCDLKWLHLPQPANAKKILLRIFPEFWEVFGDLSQVEENKEIYQFYISLLKWATDGWRNVDEFYDYIINNIYRCTDLMKQILTILSISQSYTPCQYP